MLTKAEARRVALAIAGAQERPFFGKPAIFVKDQFLTRIHDKEDAVVIITHGIEMRDMMLAAEPDLFYITDHYRNRPALLARLKVLDAGTLRDLVAARIKQIESRPEKKPRQRTAAGKPPAGTPPARKAARKKTGAKRKTASRRAKPR